MQNNSIQDLHTIIHMLSPAEKKNFKIQHASFKRKGAHNYLKLFDLINKEKKYDKDFFTTLLHRSGIKNPRVIAHHLFDMLLKSSRGVQEKNFTETKIFGLLSESELLYHRGLNNLCIKRIEKAIGIAQKLDNHYMLEVATLWKYRMMLKIKSVSTDEQLEEFNKYRVKQKQITENALDYQKLVFKFYTIMNKFNINEKENIQMLKEHIFSSSLLINERKAISTYAKIQYNHIYGIFNNAIGNFNSFYDYTKRIIYLSHQSPYIQKQPGNLIIILGNHVNACILSKHYTEAEKTLEQIKHIKATTVPERVTKFKALYIYKLDLLVAIMDKLGLTRLLTIIEKDFAEIHPMNRQIGQVYIFKVAAAYFYLKKYLKCIEWLDFLFKELGIKGRKDVFTGGKVLYLMAHWELGNHRFVEQNALSTRSYIQKKRPLYSFERALLKFFSFAQKKNGNTIAEWTHLLTTLYADLKDPSIKKQLSYFNYENWLTEKITS